MKKILLIQGLISVLSCSVKEVKMIVVGKEYSPSITATGIGTNGAVTVVSDSEKFILFVRNEKGEIRNKEVSKEEYFSVEKGDSVSVNVLYIK